MAYMPNVLPLGHPARRLIESSDRLLQDRPDAGDSGEGVLGTTPSTAAQPSASAETQLAPAVQETEVTSTTSEPASSAPDSVPAPVPTPLTGEELKLEIAEGAPTPPAS